MTDTKITLSECEIPTPLPSPLHPAARGSIAPGVILFNLSGHGHFDLSAYDGHLSGKMDLQL